MDVFMRLMHLTSTAHEEVLKNGKNHLGLGAPTAPSNTTPEEWMLRVPHDHKINTGSET